MATVYRTLGTIKVTSSGEHLGGRKKEIELEVVAACDNESFCWNSDDVMDEAHAWIEGRFKPETWYETDDALDEPYRDEAINNAVSDLVKGLGHDGWVSWSEEGLQDCGVAHFDMDIKLVEQIWPEYKLEALRAPGMR